MFSLNSHKYREFALNHFLASFLILVFYIFFSTYGFFPNSLFVLKTFVIVDFIFGLLFLFRVFGKYEDLAYAVSAIIEASIWAIYPLQDDISSHSQMCYLGGVIILCFHLQLTKVKYVYYYLGAVLLALLYIGDFEFGLYSFAHTLIASLLTIEIIRYRDKSKSLSKENDQLKAKLHNKNYFSHHLFNPLTIIKGMIGSESLPEQKVNASVNNCLDRMNGVISQFEYSDEHIVNRGGDEDIVTKKTETIASSITISILIIISLYFVSLVYYIFQSGLTFGLIPKIAIIIFSTFFYSYINSKENEKELLGSLVYFLVGFQLLMVIEFLYSPQSNSSIGVLLAGFLFSMSMAMIDSFKKIFGITIFLSLLAIVIKETLYIVMFVSFLIYFLKVLLGSKLVSIKLEEAQSNNEKMKNLYEEYLSKADKIIPIFNLLNQDIKLYLKDMKNSSEEELDEINNKIDKLIMIVRED